MEPVDPFLEHFEKQTKALETLASKSWWVCYWLSLIALGVIIR